MCLDPVTLGVMAGGMALSGAGGAIQQRNNTKYANNVAAARNVALTKSREKQKKFAEENATIFGGTLNKFDPAAQTQKLQEVQDSRADVTTQNISAPDADAVPLSGSAPQVVKGAIAQRLLEAFNDSTSKARSLAKVSGYNDLTMSHGMDVTGGARNIETTNNFSRGTAALLPYEQDFAEAQVKRPNNFLPMLLQLGGNLAGGLAGRGNISSWLSPAAAAAPPNPWANFTGVGSVPY
jgi:hypothetical protein